MNFQHELSIEAVIRGTVPGAIYVDDAGHPRSALVMTPECNLVAGDADDAPFNSGVKQRLDFHDDAIMCDTPAWERRIRDIHSNVAVRQYTRRYYQLEALRWRRYSDVLPDGYTVDYVYADNQDYRRYENGDKVSHWFNFTDWGALSGTCLGAYVRTASTIVSWCLADCVVDDRMEIGVKTDPQFRRQGLGAIAVAAAVSQCAASGIRQFGWHCVDFNVGSYTLAEKVGFVKIKDYRAYTPYPPVENPTDFGDEQWEEWARHYEAMNAIQPVYHWYAAQCWALAHNVSATIWHLQNLWRAGQKIDRGTLMEQCAGLHGDDRWDRFVANLVWD